MRIINCDRSSCPSSTADGLTKEICSRHILAFGKDVQERISQLKVGVISVGGLGSILIEQLMRLFPKCLDYIDSDIVETTNLNRLVGATAIDSKLETRKADLVTKNILQFNPQQEVVPIHGDFLERENQELLAQCDFIFGASDSNAVRIATNRLCLAHGIPYLDCGVGAIVKDNVLHAAGGQVVKILPDSGFCLHCSGLFDIGKAMKEFLPEEERERQESQGYIKGIQVAAPQVYSLNMMVASWAVWLFIRIITGEQIDFDGIAVDAKGFKAYCWKEVDDNTHDCLTCGRHGVVFRGDDVDLLVREQAGFDVTLAGSETIDRLRQPGNHTSHDHPHAPRHA